MLEKLLQAAIITFLLHLIAGLNPSTMKTEAMPPSAMMSTPIARAVLSSVE